MLHCTALLFISGILRFKTLINKKQNTKTKACSDHQPNVSRSICFATNWLTQLTALKWGKEKERL